MTRTIEKTVEMGKLEVPPSIYPAERRASKLLPPDNHNERMEWIRSSFQSFYKHVQDKESLMEFCNKE